VGATPSDDPVEVFVYLSPVPGQERVIAVTMTRHFSKPVLVQAIIDSAVKKYPLRPTADKEQPVNRRVLSWRFDSQEDRIFPPTDADFVRACSGLPSAASPRNGVGLDVCIERPYAATVQAVNKELAAAYSATLFRESDLTKFRSQVDTVMAGFKEQRKKEEIEKAKQSGPIKF
jgi:hypothetical protein